MSFPGPPEHPQQLSSKIPERYEGSGWLLNHVDHADRLYPPSHQSLLVFLVTLGAIEGNFVNLSIGGECTDRTGSPESRLQQF